MAAKFDTVEDYVAAQPAQVQDILNELRRRVGVTVPGATEAISYGIPAVKVDGKALLYISGWKQHVAVYPVPDGDEALANDMARYRSGKGTLKFKLDEPFPYDLFDRIVLAARARLS